MNWRAGLSLLLAVVLVACEAPAPAQPTFTRQPSLAPSATVLPFASPQPSEQALGRSDATAAALAAEGEPSQEAALVAFPTQASIPLVVRAEDGVLLGAAYYGAAVQAAPTLVLLHGESGDLSRLIPLANTLQSAGYNVLLLAWRGYSDSGGEQDWSMALSDLQSAFATLNSLALSQRWALLAEGRALVVALLGCQAQPNCLAVVGLDPVPDEALFPLASLGEATLSKPLGLMAGQNQPASQALAQTLAAQLPQLARLQLYADLTADLAGLQVLLVAWLNEWLPITE